MYFELLFIISAGISLFHSEFLNNKTANARKKHMAVLIRVWISHGGRTLAYF